MKNFLAAALGMLAMIGMVVIAPQASAETNRRVCLYNTQRDITWYTVGGDYAAKSSMAVNYKKGASCPVLDSNKLAHAVQFAQPVNSYRCEDVLGKIGAAGYSWNGTSPKNPGMTTNGDPCNNMGADNLIEFRVVNGVAFPVFYGNYSQYK
jgi:hypothetical protein